WRIEVNAIATPLSRWSTVRISAGRTARGAMDCKISSIIRALDPRCGRRPEERPPGFPPRRAVLADRVGRSLAVCVAAAVRVVAAARRARPRPRDGVPAVLGVSAAAAGFVAHSRL